MTNVILINVWMIENVRGNYPAETRAVLRLECSLDFISGSEGHQ